MERPAPRPSGRRHHDRLLAQAVEPARCVPPRRRPPSWLRATDPDGFGQVGCIYTAQGFEYDWSGVILGEDLGWRQDRWLPNLRPAGTLRSAALTPPPSSAWSAPPTKSSSPVACPEPSCIPPTPKPRHYCAKLVPAPTAAEPDPPAPVQQPT
ncbi:DNA/RNA helicase domain-containing protein [Streptomyces sp. NPDC054888]